MFNTGEVRRNGFLNAQVATIQQRLQEASEARAREAAGGKIEYMGVSGITDEELAKVNTVFYREGYEYYFRTHPTSTLPSCIQKAACSI